jgi:hypothetical protein
MATHSATKHYQEVVMYGMKNLSNTSPQSCSRSPPRRIRCHVS